MQGLFTGLRALWLCVACGWLVPASSEAAETLRLQLKWAHAFQFAGYYAADAKGYYREAGLDVQLIEAAPDTDVVGRVTAGEAEFGIGTSNLLLDRHAGRPVMALAAIFQHSPQVILARHDDKLQSVHDLKGKRLMLEQQSGELLAYLQREGLRREALQLLPHNFDANSLMAGSTDALSAYQIFEPFLLDQRQFPYIQLSPRAAGIDFYGDVLFTSEAQYLRHRERTQAFVTASLRGWEYATEHPDEVIALIRARYPDRLSTEHLKFEAEKSIPMIRNDLVPIGYMHRGRWQHIADTFAEIGMLPPGFNFDGFLPQPAPATDFGRIALWLIGLSLLAALAGGAALYVTRLNRQLQRSRQTLADRASDLELQNASWPNSMPARLSTAFSTPWCGVSRPAIRVCSARYCCLTKAAPVCATAPRRACQTFTTRRSTAWSLARASAPAALPHLPASAWWSRISPAIPSGRPIPN